MAPIIAALLLSVSLLCSEANMASPDGSFLADLDQLYRLDDLRNGIDGYYDLESRSSPNEDWNNIGYQEPTLNDDIFSEASIRDQEFAEHSPLWGYQSVSGGTGDGKDNPKQVKTDKVLPAYCNPPNPCPIGYTADDNCVENFENTPDKNRQLMKQQECPCDAEHMVSCPANNKITSKSASISSVIDQLGNLENNAYLSSSQKRKTLVAKKSPFSRLKRDTESIGQRQYYEGHKVEKKDYNHRQRTHTQP